MTSAWGLFALESISGGANMSGADERKEDVTEGQVIPAQS